MSTLTIQRLAEDLLVTSKATEREALIAEIKKRPRFGLLAGPVFIGALKRKAALVRASAAEAIGEIGLHGEVAETALTEAPRDSDDDVRTKAASALLWMRPEMLKTAQELDHFFRDKSQLESSRSICALALAEMGKAGALFLRAALLAGDSFMRIKAATACCRLLHGQDLIVSGLVDALEDRDEDVILAAQDALCSMKQRAIPGLKIGLKEKKGRSRVCVAQALNRIQNTNQEAITCLLEALKGKNESLRLRVLGPGTIFCPSLSAVVPGLARSLKAKDKEARYLAASALSKIGPKARPATLGLVDALEDPEARVRWAAAEALSAIDSNAEETLPALVRHLADQDTDVRFFVLRALGSLGPKAAAALPEILQCAGKEESIGNKIEAIRTIGEIGPGARQAVPILISIRQKAVPLMEILTENRCDLKAIVDEALAKINGTK